MNHSLRIVRQRRGVALLPLVLVALTVGCQELAKPPVRFGVTRIELIGPQLLPRWARLRTDLSLELGENVQFEVLTPHQIQVHLGSGRLSFAMVDAAEYAQIAPAENDVPLAVAVNRFDQTQRVGLIVTGADSDIHALADLRGKRFDFGPADDSVLEKAAVCTLAKEGVTLDDIEPDPLFGGLRRHINSQEVAKAVVYEKAAGGIVDEAEYERWPKTGGTVLLGLVSQDQLRILERTIPVPEMVVLASKQANPALVAQVKNYFLDKVNHKQIAVLSFLGLRGFAPVDRQRYAAFCALYDATYPKEEASSTEADDALPVGSDADDDASRKQDNVP